MMMKDSGTNKYRSFLWSMLYLTDFQDVVGHEYFVSRLNRTAALSLGQTTMQIPILTEYPALCLLQSLHL
jgi:hypothetical protein